MPAIVNAGDWLEAVKHPEFVYLAARLLAVVLLGIYFQSVKCD